jgi:hypothetical protein
LEGEKLTIHFSLVMEQVRGCRRTYSIMDFSLTMDQVTLEWDMSMMYLAR